MGDFVPQTPYWGFAPGPLDWGTSVPQTSFPPFPHLCLLFNLKSVRSCPVGERVGFAVGAEHKLAPPKIFSAYAPGRCGPYWLGAAG